MEEERLQRRIRRGSLLVSQGRSERLLGVDKDRKQGDDANGGEWTEHMTPEGAVYYYNALTKKTTWDIPTGFSLRERWSSTEGKEWFWIKDEVACFSAGVPLGELTDGKEGKEGLFKTLDGRTIESQVVGKIGDVRSIGKDTEDMVKMESINEASVLQNLRVRAERDEYLTNVGSILVSVNPFKWLDHLYTPEQFQLYRDRGVGDEVPPHFFEISSNAYRGLREQVKPQCIIISGESGAGKTEATKKCLQFFADVAGSHFGLENKLLATNPILEAFGNAQTVRNNNSSRFGKWTVVHFDLRGRICGGTIVNYLLEKSRVAIQMPGERSYHIFYQLVKGASEQQRDQYRLPKSLAAFNFLSPPDQTKDGDSLDDEESFQETLDAFKELEFSNSEQDDVFRVLSGVLWLGNIRFVTPVGASVDDPGQVDLPESENAIDAVSDMLGLQRDSLLRNLSNRIRVLGGQAIESPLNAQAALESCSALAREIYSRLFDWLVSRLNQTLNVDSTKVSSDSSIGVLDIFGFEIFKNNSFEQLCINFTNEKLQQHFNNHTFKTEQQVYEAQGIQFDPPSFRDNADVLDLMEQKPQGIFVLLDEECVLPRGSDASFVNKIVQVHGKSHPRFAAGPKLKTKAKLAFAVEHYAGLVVYNAEQFLEKNKDDLRENLLQLVASSKNSFLRDVLFHMGASHLETEQNDHQDLNGSTPSAKKKRYKTQSGFFRNQLNQLMDELNTAEPHYIRCIKPNARKVADRFDPFLCLEQLRYSGIFEAIEIRKQGFPFRRLHKDFYQRYRGLLPRKELPAWPFSGDFTALSKSLIEALAAQVLEMRKIPPISPAHVHHLSDLNECRIGKTMVLYRAPEHLTLESLREKKRNASALFVTSLCRGFLARCRVRHFRSLCRELKEAMQARKAKSIEKALKQLEERVKPPFSIYREKKQAEELIKRIHEEEEICLGIEELEELLSKSSNSAAAYYEDISSILDKAAEYNIATLYPKHAKTLKDFDKKIASVRDLINAKKDLVASVDTGLKEDLVAAIKRAEKLTEKHGAFCDMEMKRAKTLLEKVVKEAKLVDKLVAAMENGGFKGKVGSLNTSSIDTALLRQVLQETKEKKEKLTPRTAALVRHAEMVATLREGLRDKNWDTVEGILARIDQVQPDFEKFRLPRVDIELIRDELNCHTIVYELSCSVGEGYVAGEPGNLDSSCVGTEHLKADIEDAKVLGSPAPVAHAVIAAAERILHLRESVLLGDWKAVEKILLDIHAHPLDDHDEYALQFSNASEAELSLLNREIHHRQIIDRVFDSVSGGNVGGSVGDISTKSTSTKKLSAVLKFIEEIVDEDGDYPTKQAKHLCLFVKKLLEIRTACQKKAMEKLSGGELVNKALEYATRYHVPPPAIEELRLIRSELAERECIGILEESVRKGAVGGKVGAVKLDLVSAEPLQQALARVQDVWKEAGHDQGPSSKAGTKLVESVRELSRLRNALKVEDWDLVEDILANSTALFTKATDEEVTLIQEELNNRTIIAELNRALCSGGPPKTGAIGELEVASLEVASLRDDIADAKELGCKTKEAKSLLENATLVLELREALVQSKWEQVEKVVDKCRFTQLAPPVKEEVHRVEQELNNRKILHELTHALSIGGPSGTLDDLRVDTITFHSLDDTLALAQKLKCQSAHAIALYSAAKLVRSSRAVMTQGRFTQLGPLVEDAERLGFLRVQAQDDGFDEDKFEFASPARQELELMRDKFHDEMMREELVNALLEGKPGGRVGALDISNIKLGTLLKLTAKHSLDEPRTRKAKQLLTCANMIVALREALLSGPDWSEVEKVTRMFDSDQMLENYGFDTVTEVQEELDLIRDELEHRKVLALLTEGIEVGSVRGSIGALDLKALSIDTLNSSLEKVKVLHRKTPESNRLYNTAIALRDVRACILEARDEPGKDMASPLSEMKWLGSVQVALDKAHGVGVSDIAKEELKLVQDHVDDIKITRELCAALSQGSVRGTLGETHASTCDKDRLLSALNCAHTLVCKTERAKKLEKTAKVVLQLRKALLEDGWQAIGTALEKSLGVSIEGGTPPDAFHGFSDEASGEFQRMIDEVRERLIRSSLELELKRGPIAGDPGSLFVEEVDFAKLEKTVRFALRVGGHLSKQTKDLASLGSIVVQVREAFRHGGKEEVDVESVASVLAGLNGFTSYGSVAVPQEVVAELTLAQNHVHDFKILACAAEAVRNGSGGDPLDISTIDPSPIQVSLKTINGSLGGPKSERATDAVAALSLLLDLRIALQNQAFEDLRIILGKAIECGGISHFEEAESQIYAARSLLMNFDTVMSLKSVARTGAVLDHSSSPSAVDWVPLEKAVKVARSQVAGDFQTSVSSLLDRCDVICELRRSFRLTVEDNWSAVESVLAKLSQTSALTSEADVSEDIIAAAGSAQNEARHALIRQLDAEVRVVKDLHGDRMALHLLVEAMSEGHLGGTVGNVSTALIKTSSLEQAIEVANDANFLSHKTESSLHHAKYLLSLRRSVIADDWSAVYQVARRWREETSTKPPLRRNSIGSLVDDDSEQEDEIVGDSNLLCYALELQLAWEEANRRIVVDALSQAITTGCVTGTPGALSTHQVSIANLNKAIAKALEVGVRTADAQQLLLAAHTIRQLRNGILSDVEEGGGGGHVDCPKVREALQTARNEGIDVFPDVAQREILLVQAELEDQDAAKALSSALRDGGLTSYAQGDPVVVGVEALASATSQVQEDHCHTGFSKALYKLAFIMKDLRSAKLEQAWDEAARCVRVVDDIRAKVNHGDAPISTQETQKQQWRAALLLVQHEVDEARDEIDNARTVTKLREAMLSGRAPGKPGHLKLAGLHIEDLDTALEYAVEVGCKTDEATVLYKTSRLLRQLRASLLQQDFVTASVILSEAQSYAVSLGEPVSAPRHTCFHRLPVAGGEFELLSYEVENHLVRRALKSALRAGEVTGRVGAVTVTESNVQGLEKAMAKAEGLRYVHDETHNLIHSCKVILKLRQLLVETPLRIQHDGNAVTLAHIWESAEAVISSAIATAPGTGLETSRALYDDQRQVDSMVSSLENGKVQESGFDEKHGQHVHDHGRMVVVPYHGSNGTIVRSSRNGTRRARAFDGLNLLWCHPEARTELTLLLDEIQHREAVQHLLSALAFGHAKFMGGFVDVSTVKTGALETAISNAKLVRVRTDEITSLQLSATIIQRSREALLDGSWQSLQQLLEEASEVAIHEAAVDELNLLKREMHLHSVIKSVLLNLHQASVDRNVDALEAALREADTLRLGSSPDLHVLSRVNKARQLYDRLVVLDDRLQQCIKRADLQGLENTLEEATKLKYQPRAANLANDMRSQLRSLFEEADRAIEAVDPSGLRDALEKSKRQNIILPRADEMRRLLSYPPSQLEKMRLNAAIERGDEETVCDVTMAIKSRFFEQETTRERHRLEYFSGLKSPGEFASNTGVIASSLADGMLCHSTTPIPTSLTRLPSTPATSLAVKIFRALLGYCGDRPYSYPSSLAQEILQVGLSVPEVRDEIFLQLIKQLTDNPSQTSRERAWCLFHLCLQCFPPSEGFENFLELWLRRKAVEMRGRKFFGASSPSAADDLGRRNWPGRCLREMHRIVFRGPAGAIPSLEPVQELLHVTSSDQQRF